MSKFDRKFDRADGVDAVAAFLAQGGEVQKVKAEASTFAEDASRIAQAAGMSDRAERRLARQLKTGYYTVEEAEGKYLPPMPVLTAENAAEIRMETYVGARFGGASVDQALEEANYVVNNYRR